MKPLSLILYLMIQNLKILALLFENQSNIIIDFWKIFMKQLISISLWLDVCSHSPLSPHSMVVGLFTFVDPPLPLSSYSYVGLIVLESRGHGEPRCPEVVLIWAVGHNQEKFQLISKLIFIIASTIIPDVHLGEIPATMDYVPLQASRYTSPSQLIRGVSHPR